MLLMVHVQWFDMLWMSDLFDLSIHSSFGDLLIVQNSFEFSIYAIRHADSSCIIYTMYPKTVWKHLYVFTMDQSKDLGWWGYQKLRMGKS